MSKLDIILKIITLLHRETELELMTNTTSDTSKDLVKTILDGIEGEKDNALFGGDSELVKDLIQLIRDMVQNHENYDKLTLIQSLEVILKDRESLIRTVDKAINIELQTKDLKRTIVSLRNTLNNYFRLQQLKKIVGSASYKLNQNQLGDMSLSDFTNALVVNLEALSIVAKSKDPGIMNELDMNNPDGVADAMDEVKKLGTDNGRLITGWTGVNTMTGGGFIRGEEWVITALQHSFKSGFVQSMFTQISTLNKPIMDDPTKKPLNILLSFEDDMHIMTGFIYKYLYYNENHVLPDLTLLTGKEIGEYITSRLTKTGYHVKILRVNPDEWSYKHLFNKLLEYEADGFEIHALVVDYLSKMPTTGCIKTGAMGTDIRDLFNKLRNFGSSHRFLTLTPHQLSTEAVGLTRSGIKNKEFLDEISNNNYYEGSKQIPQVVDGEIYLFKGTINRKWNLFVGRGKHRNPKIISEEDKRCVLPFPPSAPILEDYVGGNNPKAGETQEALDDIGSKIAKDFDF